MQYPSEFNSEEKIVSVFNINGLHIGRMISGSKSRYLKLYPDNDVVFNANIVTESQGKVWHGDLDVTMDRKKLEKVSETLGEPLYILYEMDARFDHEDDPIELFIKRAKFIINP